MGPLEMLLAPESMEVRFDHRTLGVFNRDDVRAWMQSPRTPLAADQCALSMQRRGIAIALGCANPDLMPRHVSQQLRAAVCGA
jgi:hypothetical protein